MSQKKWIMAFVLGGCILMAMVDGSRMDYVTKAILKIFAFVSLPLIYSKWISKLSLRSLFVMNLNHLKIALGLGVILFVTILV